MLQGVKITQAPGTRSINLIAPTTCFNYSHYSLFGEVVEITILYFERVILWKYENHARPEFL